jgi:hypothetical protein
MDRASTTSGMTRRNFLQSTGAGLAAASVAGSAFATYSG